MQVALFFCVLVLLALSKGEESTKLQFNKDGTFKIVHFTDLHFGGSNNDDKHTVAVQGTVLDNEKPDLVVITGDLVSGYLWNKQDNWFHDYWVQLTEPMISRNIRWAIALGNHDIEADLTAQQVIELDSSHPLSLTQLGPSSIAGAGNYFLPIYKNQSNDPGFMLWMFDSGHTDCMGVPGWGCIQTSQVTWYKNASSYFTDMSTAPVPGMAFFHIPLYEHLDLWNSRPVYGQLGETVGVCCSSVNTGLYAAMKEMNDVKHVFCGHDHSNDYYGDYWGINLGYGRKTGYGSYGPPKGWKHGARVMEVSQKDGAVKTWLRLEDGSVEVQSVQKPGTSTWEGCCDMAGHGSEVAPISQLMSSSTLYLYLFNATWMATIMLCIFVGRQCYRRLRGRVQTDVEFQVVNNT